MTLLNLYQLLYYHGWNIYIIVNAMSENHMYMLQLPKKLTLENVKNLSIACNVACDSTLKCICNELDNALIKTMYCWKIY